MNEPTEPYNEPLDDSFALEVAEERELAYESRIAWLDWLDESGAHNH